MDITAIIEYGMTAIGGGAVFKALDYFINIKKENRSDFDMINQRLNEEIKRLYERLNLLEKENTVLEERVKILEGTVEDLPFPMWHKDLNGRYSWVNQSYVDSLLTPIGKTGLDVMGNLDTTIWNQQVSDMFLRLEIVARSSPSRNAYERGVVLNQSLPTYTIYKFPLYLKRILIGYGGIALSEN